MPTRARETTADILGHWKTFKMPCVEKVNTTVLPTAQHYTAYNLKKNA